MDKELRRLKRSELIEIIYQQKKKEQELQKEIEHLKAQLNKKSLKLENVGSIAEAAISISEVVEAAQRAADIYLEEIKLRQKDAKHESEEIIKASTKESEYIISQSKKEASDIIAVAKKDAEAILQNAIRQKIIVEEQCKNLKKDGNES